MEINDLRVGNLVFVQDEIHKVEGIIGSRKSIVNGELTKQYIYTSFQFAYHDFENVVAIPLTYRILKKFGFIDPANNGCSARRSIDKFHEICLYVFDKELRFQTEKSGYTTMITHIDSVHKLQNFWYFYTGEELEYTLTK
jgi:hypothetical protein